MIAGLLVAILAAAAMVVAAGRALAAIGRQVDRADRATR